MVIVIHINTPNLQKRVRFCFRPLKVASTCWRLRFPIPHLSEVGWDASWRSWSRYSPTGWPTLWCLRTSFKMFLLKLETNFKDGMKNKSSVIRCKIKLVFIICNKKLIKFKMVPFELKVWYLIICFWIYLPWHLKLEVISFLILIVGAEKVPWAQRAVTLLKTNQGKKTKVFAISKLHNFKK